MAIINPEWVTKGVGSFQTADEMNTLAAAVKNNAVELQTDINNLSTHISNKSNPHEVTKVQLDLDNVDNVSDINKPVSIAQAEAIAVVQTNLNNHKADVNNPHGVTKVQIGLSEVNNTSDINKPVSTATQNALDTKENILNKGIAGGYAALDEYGKIPEDQLPSSSNDVLEFISITGFPITGESGKIYIDKQTNKLYRWENGSYVYIKSGAVDSVAGKTGIVILDKNDVGLSNVDNTSDILKPVSAAQASAIDIVQSDIDIHKLEVNNPHSVTKAQVGLGNVDDTSDVNKPISIAQHAAIDAVQDDLNIHKNNTDNPHNVTKTQLGLSAVDNTADVNKPISIATQTALNLKADKVRQMIAGSGLTGGGDLSADRTYNVVSANDGITVNADNIQLNTIDNLTTTSTTKPLSANQGKTLNDSLTQLQNLVKYSYQWYGIEWDITISTSSCTRIGNLSLHNTLPIQSKLRRCVLNDTGNVVYYLGTTDSTKKEDGVTTAILDGTDGQIMVEIPEFYYQWETDGNKRRLVLSLYPIFLNKSRKMYISAYECALNRINNKLSSVVNTTVDYRGGTNDSALDALPSTLLGKPVTNLSLTTFRTYARNRGSINWNCYLYEAHKAICMLYYTEYSNFNSQLPYNSNLDGNGYKQGGLSDGITNFDGTKWNNFNSSNPFIACGSTNSLGNNTGIISYTAPFEYDSNGSTNYKGTFNISTSYITGNYVSSAQILYRCILDSTGNDITNTTYFTVVSRTTSNITSYRGIENPFGHVWKWTDGCKFNIQTSIAGDKSLFYTCDNPNNYQDTNYVNYNIKGYASRTSGWFKTFINGEIIPENIGGSSSTYIADYFYTDAVGSPGQRGVLFGGAADPRSSAGLGFVYSNSTPSYATPDFGSRLCYIYL